MFAYTIIGFDKQIKSKINENICLNKCFTALPQRSDRIVGGSPTTVEQYPYMSNMQYGYWGIWWQQSCGGSLITTTAVLSAAHCYQFVNFIFLIILIIYMNRFFTYIPIFI